MIPVIGALVDAGLNLVSKFVDSAEDKAVKVIKEKTGIDLSNKQSLNQDEIKKLKMFEEMNKEFLLKEIELANKDRANARDLQKEALKYGDLFSKNFVYGFALLWTVFAFAYIYMITFTDIPKANVRFADTILGFMLGTALAGILQFFYGSSLGSKKKDEMLEKNKK